jgi:hypothetical protein
MTFPIRPAPHPLDSDLYRSIVNEYSIDRALGRGGLPQPTPMVSAGVRPETLLTIGTSTNPQN